MRKRLHRLAYHRNRKGFILPIVALAIIMLMAYAGFSVDVMRNFHAVNKLQFAADAAAMYAYSFATAATAQTGAFGKQSVINAALSTGTDNAWNRAPSGPASLFMGPWSSAVRFTTSDIIFVNNPLDASEVFLQVTARRDGVDALNQYIMPVLYALNTAWSDGGVPADLYQKEPYRISEVVGQPASRIGPGPERQAAAGSAAAAFMGFACFPLAVSNNQFQQIASPGTPAGGSYTIDFPSSQSTLSLAANHVYGCFVNVAPSNSALTYYGGSQSASDVTQLINLTKYFAPAADPAAVAPAAVERGSELPTFDPANPAFAAQKSTLFKTMQAVLYQGKYCILPVIQSDPVFGGTNKVAGFAWVRINSVDAENGLITFNTVPSMPIRNAAVANDFASIPSFDGTRIPAPVAPFQSRTYDRNSNGLSLRPVSVVLAPASSPRTVAPSLNP